MDHIFFLLSISAIPFTAALIGDYPSEWLALTLYGLNLICASLLLYFHWWYASAEGRLLDTQLDRTTQILIARRILTQPVVYGVAIALSFVNPLVSLIIYVVTPLLYIFPTRLDRVWIYPVLRSPSGDQASASRPSSSSN